MTKNNIKELSIQVNLNGLSFCILNRTTNTIEYLNKVSFNQKLTPYDTLNRLKAELSNNIIFSDDFDDVTILHQNELSTLVPKPLYSENNKADYLKFNSKILRTDFITKDDITINNSVNVYVPYVNINNFIFETFGEFIYKHTSTVFIDLMLQNRSTEHQETKVIINVNEATLDILVIGDNQLKLINTFDYNTKEDFIYYVLFVFEQLSLDVENHEVSLVGNINKGDDLFNILYKYVRHVAILETNYKFKFSDKIDKENLNHHYLILNSF